MAIFITGDIHGEIDIHKLASGAFDSQGLTKDDYVIILGDFGLLWTDPISPEEQYWLDWLEEKPFTTLFLDGNHENFDLLEQYSVQQWHGGQVQFITDSIIHLMRGEAYEIEGSSFFVFGGAYSHDKEFRTEGYSWWPQEVPSAEEREHGLQTLERLGWKVDYVLTHEAPFSLFAQLVSDPTSNEFARWLQLEVADNLQFKQWFFGHHHVDLPYMKPFTPLYNEIYDLTGTGRTEYGSHIEWSENSTASYAEN